MTMKTLVASPSGDHELVAAARSETWGRYAVCDGWTVPMKTVPGAEDTGSM